MTDSMTYMTAERVRAAAWKQRTSTLIAEARLPAPFVSKEGTARGRAYDFCLPATHAALSLLPEVREPAIDLFADSASRGMRASPTGLATTCCLPRCSASTHSGRW